tara:strand:+ start:3477 stop:5243 length:1767 start_codon:yes stop_codon:yes gene_type:complete
MPLTREERKLLHQKSKQPTFGVNKPDAREGHEGDIAYRRVEGSGTVQYVKENGDWTAIASSGKMPKSRNIITAPSSSRTAIIDHGDLAGLGNDNHTQYLLISGDRAMTGNLDMGSQSIVSVVNVTASGIVQAEQLTSTDDASIGDALDVDGHTTLDKTTIDTTDGAFTVSGSNSISLITTGSNDININTNQTLDVDINEDYEMYVRDLCDWNTSTVDWDNASTFTLTSVDNLTIETSGATTAKTILLFNDNNHASAFRGIHLKVDAQGAVSSQNSILIECVNRNSKGGGIGVDISSADGVLIRAEDANNGDESGVQIRATESVDLAGGSNNITPTTGTPKRTKIHDTTEIEKLYRPNGSKILTNLDTITSGNETGHTEFESINTLHLLRATTIIVKNSTTLFTDATCDTTSGDATVTFTSTGNANAGLISDGMKVTGTGIPSNSFVTSKTTSSFELRDVNNNPVNATANGTNVTLSFFNYINKLYNNDFILIASILNDQHDDAVGTMWKISISYDIGSTDLAQVWYCAKQNNKFAWLGNSNGETLAANDKGILTWTSSNGIRWQNVTGGAVESVRCSALKIHSGTNDF